MGTGWILAEVSEKSVDLRLWMRAQLLVHDQMNVQIGVRLQWNRVLEAPPQYVPIERFTIGDDSVDDVPGVREPLQQRPLSEQLAEVITPTELEPRSRNGDRIADDVDDPKIRMPMTDPGQQVRDPDFLHDAPGR